MLFNSDMSKLSVCSCFKCLYSTNVCCNLSQEMVWTKEKQIMKMDP